MESVSAEKFWEAPKAWTDSKLSFDRMNKVTRIVNIVNLTVNLLRYFHKLIERKQPVCTSRWRLLEDRDQIAFHDEI